MESYRLRSTLAIFGLLFAIVWVLPNVVNVENLKWWPVKNKLNYGLDIQGGVHLVMGVDVDGVVAESTERLVTGMRTELETAGLTGVEVKSAVPSQGELQITVPNADAQGKVEKLLTDNHGTTLQVLNSNPNLITVRYLDTYLMDYKNKVITQAIETIRNRIDEFGVAEPSITQQGSDRILVQLPGMADAERAKELINTTAKLDFMIISSDVTTEQLRAWIADAEKAGNYSLKTMKYGEYVNRLNADLKGKLPENTAVYFEKAPNAQKME
ncbi:MAG: protein translocase subunit SecD, partial [Bdellovibrionota bacterium]